MEERAPVISAVRWVYTMLALTAVAGLLMRAMPWLPDVGLEFSKVRHAHSHLAFLGWVFGAYQLAFVAVLQGSQAFSALPCRRLFWAGQATALLMFAAFLAQGYGAATISLLTLHTVFAGVFFYRFISTWDKKAAPIPWLFGITAIAAFLLSAAGPFAIPLVKHFGTGNPAEARMAVHFYLHFHYNGWFVFGGLAILFGILKKEHIEFSHSRVRFAWILLSIGLLPAYFMNAPIALMPANWNLLVAIVQWVGVVVLIIQILRRHTALQAGRPAEERYWLYLAFCSFFLKYTLEVLVLLPPLRDHIDPGNHYLVIGYLHLLFLGAITPFIIWMSMRLGWLPSGMQTNAIALVFYGAGTIGTEAYLFSMGLGFEGANSMRGLLVSSMVLALGVFLKALSLAKSRA